MIDVSNDYKLMMQGREVSSRIEVEIRSGDSVVNLTDDDIVKGSLSINWRASNNRDFSLGTTYATAVSFSSFVSVIPEIEGQYVTVSMTVYYKVGNTEQMIPLGVFRCDAPSVKPFTTYYECYDCMLAFDKDIESRFIGTPYNVIDFICNRCGVENGMTTSQVSHMINGTEHLTIDPERVVTYRDALSLVSIILGGYCLINRAGKLVVRQFHSTPDMFLPRHRRQSTTFSGYKTVINGVKCRFLAEQNFYPYSIIDEQTEGILIDLGDIPIIDNTEQVKRQILQNIFDLITGYEYYPCEIEMVGDPSIEAGDMITTLDREGYEKNILLTSVTYNWRASSSIVSEGGNPKSKAVASALKRTKAEQDQITKASQIVTATYVNGQPITVDDSEHTEITSLRFTTNKELTAIFGAEIPIYSDGDGYIEIAYMDAGVTGDVVKARIHEGYNLITLVNHLYYEASRIVLLQLKAQTEPLSEQGTAPEVSIYSDTIRSYIFAQGLETEAPWDGIITISENIAYVETRMLVYGLTDGIEVSIGDPVVGGFSDALSALAMEMQTYQLSDTMSLTLEVGEEYLRCGAGHRAGNGRMFAPLNMV